MPRSDELLTAVELEFMNIIWSQGGGTVKDVQSHLPPERDLAYTSISTILRILEKKEILISVKEGRGHRYLPKLTKKQYESRSVTHLVSNVFDGTPIALVKRLIDDRQITQNELQQLKDFLDQKESE